MQQQQEDLHALLLECEAQDVEIQALRWECAAKDQQICELEARNAALVYQSVVRERI